jgi:Fe2+ transport protein
MRTVLASAVCLAALVAGGCGDDDGAGTRTSEASRSAAAAPGVPEGVAAQYRQIADEVAAEGGEQRVGPWRIAYIVEPAEGWFEASGGELRWRAPAAGETHHIEILPLEASTGRLVPNVPITLEVIDAQGDRVARQRLPMYYAEFFHYADNFAIPGDGAYTLRATLGAPDLRRHGEQAEAPALAEGATATFENVELTAEQAGR